MTDETWQVRVHGRVQGVGYREFCVDAARRLGIRGWVRNRRDGTVEALLQGAPLQLEALCEKLREGPAFAVVQGLDLVVSSNPDAPCTHFERLATC